MKNNQCLIPRGTFRFLFPLVGIFQQNQVEGNVEICGITNQLFPRGPTYIANKQTMGGCHTATYLTENTECTFEESHFWSRSDLLCQFFL